MTEAKTNSITKSDSKKGGCCSFCSKPFPRSGPMVEGPNGVLICYACAIEAKRLIAEYCFRKGMSPIACLFQ